MDRTKLCLSRDARESLTARLRTLIGSVELGELERIDERSIVLGLGEHGHVKLLLRENLILELASGRRIGYLADRWEFPDPGAFDFLGLSGPTVGLADDTERIRLIGANPNCKLSVEMRDGRAITLKKNYPGFVGRDAVDRVNGLLEEHSKRVMLRHFGTLELSRYPAATDSGLAPRIETGEAVAEAGKDEDGNEDEKSEDQPPRNDDNDSNDSRNSDGGSGGVTARSDREYIELLLRNRPPWLDRCIYHDANYPLDRCNVDTLLAGSREGTTATGTAAAAVEFETSYLTPCMGRTGGCGKGFFAYDSRRGLWLPCNDITIEETLVRSLLALPDLTAADRKYLGRNANSATLRQIFAKFTETRGLEIVRRSLRNINFFAMNGSLVENGTRLRPIEETDAVFANSGWSYRPDLAREHRTRLDEFLERLFPLEAERRAVLEYVADLLDGHRQKKGFLVLTDHRQGNNGKSTFLKLLHVFFGEAYYAKSTKFLIASSRNERNSHDAGLESMNGKRVLVADEFAPSAHLDTATIKDLVSVPDTVVQGRSFGRANVFKFVWQSGIIMAFNEGQFPQFDTTDDAFLARMIVCNMRSRFLFTGVGDDHDETLEPYTFQANVDIVSSFPAWCSAFLDILMETRRRSSDRAFRVPESMIAARNELVSDMRDSDGQLSEWLSELIESESANMRIGERLESERRTDETRPTPMVLSAIDVYDEYMQHRENRPKLHLDRISRRTFVRKLETVCNARTIGSRCSFKRRYQSRHNGTNRQRRNVIVVEQARANEITRNEEGVR